MSPSLQLRCPVCKARFRSEVICSRCGASLGRLMELALASFHLRERARASFDAGDPGAAAEFASRAQGLHRTEAGDRLERLARLLKPVQRPRARSNGAGSLTPGGAAFGFW